MAEKKDEYLLLEVLIRDYLKPTSEILLLLEEI